jgi:uncharacterized protein (DUF1697 family)
MAARKDGRPPSASGSHVALLRGINVAGKNSLPMKDLVALFDAAGCVDTRAYIQSGNLIFRASRKLASGLATVIEKAVADRFGLSVPVLVRTTEELARVTKENPFLRTGANLDTLHVAFLAHLPSAERVAALDPGRSPPDEFSIRGREIYLRCPNGYGRSKLTNQYFDSKLGTTSTIRNWKTVLKLVELTAG